MRLAFAGTPDVAVPSLDALIASRHDVVAVITRPDAPSGRGRRLESSPVAVRAREAGIEVLTPQRPREEDFLARLGALEIDVCPVVAYGALVPRVRSGRAPDRLGESALLVAARLAWGGPGSARGHRGR